MSSIALKYKGIATQYMLLFYNVSQFVGWAFILYAVVIYILTNTNYAICQDESILELIKIVQVSQYIDTFFALIGLSQTKVLPSFIQVTTKNFVVWLVFPNGKSSNMPPMAVISWALADMIRYATYINDSMKLGYNWIKVLRYNAFIILYPIGLTGEFSSAGDAKTLLENEKRNDNVSIFGTTLPVDVISCLKVFRLIAYPGLAYMMIHMFKLRSRFYSKKKESAKSTETQKAKDTTPKEGQKEKAGQKVKTN